MKRFNTLFPFLVLVITGPFPATAQMGGKRPAITVKNADQVKQVVSWDVTGGQTAGNASEFKAAANSVAFSPDGSLLASGIFDNTLKLWDVASFQPEATFQGPTNSVYSVAFSPDGTLLASGSNNIPPYLVNTDPKIWLWDVKTGQPKAILPSGKGPAGSVTFSPDGSLLADAYAGTAQLNPDGSQPWAIGGVQLWDVKSGRLGAYFQNEQKDIGELDIVAVAFSPDGLLLAAASQDPMNQVGGAVQLWSVKSHKLIATLQHNADYVDADTVAFSPDGSLLASGSDDASYGGTVRLWNVKSLKLIATLQAHDTGILSVAFSPDGTLLASGGQHSQVYLWDVKTDKLISTLEGHTDSVTGVAFSPDGTLLASSSDDGTVRVWDIPTPQLSGTAMATP